MFPKMLQQIVCEMFSIHCFLVKKFDFIHVFMRVKIYTTIQYNAIQYSEFA